MPANRAAALAAPFAAAPSAGTPSAAARVVAAGLATLTLLSCGAKSDLNSRRAWSLSRNPDCLVEGEERACTSICGEGTEYCTDGTWQHCDAPRAKPPKLRAVVRDFQDTHPDFEQPGFMGQLDLDIVEFELGPDDKPVYSSRRPSTPTTTGKAEFDLWFRDVPGENITLERDIELVPSPSDPNLFIYESSAFFPIDDDGFGNQGRVHNYHFTVEIETRFRYVGGETFRFTGDDDLWVFVNRRLAIDIGGRHDRLSDYVNLDEAARGLGLEVGSDYPLHLFFAERHTVGSNFNIATTIAEFEFCE